MDFFEAQARAKRRTARLVLLFVAAVVGTSLAGYAAALLIIGFAGGSQELWQPLVFWNVAGGTIFVVLIGTLFKTIQFSAGGGAVAESVGGRRVEPGTTDPAERRLLNVVEEMAIASGVPLPGVYVLDDEPAINAFAAGLTTSDAVVAVTRGTLEKLSRDELQGVIGHEFSHVLNGDMKLNVRLTAIVFGILVIGLAGRMVLGSLGRGRVRTSSRGDRDKGGGLALVVAIGAALFVVGYVGYFFGRLIQSAVSRQREFLADASAVQFTRNPDGIAGALKKIGGYALGSSMTSARSEALGHFFFAQGFRSMLGGLWATHPPLGERLRAIDPSFDGKYFEPEQVVNVARESFQTAGFAPRVSPAAAAELAFSRPARVPPRPPARRIPFRVGAVAAQAGRPTPADLDHAQALLQETPAAVRRAAESPDQARELIFALLLDSDPVRRDHQLGIVARQAGPASEALTRSIFAGIQTLPPGHRLPLIQLDLPALARRTPDELARFLGILDELVHADGTVSIFEFALQRMLIHHLRLGPGHPGVAPTSGSRADDIGSVLAALAAAGRQEPDAARQAYQAGARRLGLEVPSYRHQEFPALDRLGEALDRLARAPFSLKRSLLEASAETIGTDGTISVEEGELLRAVATTLDIPLPPSSVGSDFRISEPG